MARKDKVLRESFKLPSHGFGTIIHPTQGRVRLLDPDKRKNSLNPSMFKGGITGLNQPLDKLEIGTDQEETTDAGKTPAKLAKKDTL